MYPIWENDCLTYLPLSIPDTTLIVMMFIEVLRRGIHCFDIGSPLVISHRRLLTEYNLMENRTRPNCLKYLWEEVVVGGGNETNGNSFECLSVDKIQFVI